jgi:hypothetical protein
MSGLAYNLAQARRDVARSPLQAEALKHAPQRVAGSLVHIERVLARDACIV